jgi:hypothetical protein
MKKVINALCLAIAVYGSSCSGKQDVIRYTEDPDNGLNKVVTVGAISYGMQYKPAAYILKMEQLDPARKEEYEHRKQQLEGMAWFNISIRVKDFEQSPLRYQVSGLEEYNARQNYYLNEAPKDIYMLYGKDTLHVTGYWFENNQNLAAHETLIVGFQLPGKTVQPQEDMQLAFYDRVFRNGIIKTIFKKEDILDAR